MRIFPEIWPSTTCPFSNLTLNVALGRFSTTSPCISITSSFDIKPFSTTRQRRATLEIRLLQQALVLVRHQISLNLGHEVHRDNHDDQQAGTAEVERHVPLEDQE